MLRFSRHKKSYLADNYIKINGCKKRFRGIAGYEIQDIDKKTCLYLYLKNSWVLKSILPVSQSVTDVKNYFNQHRILDLTGQEKPKALAPIFCLGLFATLVSLSYWLCVAIFYFIDIRAYIFSYHFRVFFIIIVGAILFVFRTKFFRFMKFKMQNLIGAFLLFIPFVIFSIQFFHKPIFRLDEALQPAFQAEESAQAWIDFVEMPNLEGDTYELFNRTNKVEIFTIAKQRWSDSEELRKAWRALNLFDEIADRPSIPYQEKFFGRNSNPRIVPYIFYMQALVDIDNSNLVSALDNTYVAYSVLRKLYHYKIDATEKLFFGSRINAFVDCYNKIIDSPLCTPSLLTNIYNQLPVLTDQERDLYTSQMGDFTISWVGCLTDFLARIIN